MKKQYVFDADKKIDVSLAVILLLSVFLVWQMGVLFYSGNSLSVYGRTPVPVEEPLTTLIIAIGYIVTILVHVLYYREESVKTYKKNIYAELDVHSKRELFTLANARIAEE